MKIRNKLFLNLFLVAALGLTAIFGIVYFVSKDIMTSTIAGYNTLLAKDAIDSVDRLVDRRLENWEDEVRNNIRRSPVLQASNEKFAAMSGRDAFIAKQEAAWQSSPDELVTPFMKAIIDNDLSANLRATSQFYQKRYDRNLFPEVFITNQYGVLAAATGKTTDYLQADEDWWQKAKADGIFISDIIYDESSGTNSLSFALRIDDENNKFLGAVKVVYSLQDVFNVILEVVKKAPISTKDAALGLTRQSTVASLIDSSGKLIYTTSVSGKGSTDPAVVEFYSNPSLPYLIRSVDGVEKIYSHAHSDGYFYFRGLGWILTLEKNTSESLSPLNNLLTWLLLASLAMLLLVVAVAYLLANYFSNPIKKFIQEVDEVKGGNLNTEIIIKNKDEIGQLAGSFNEMVKAVKNSRKEVDFKVAEQTKEIQLKAKELAARQQALLNVLEDVDKEKNNLALAKAQDEAILTGIGDGVFVLNADRKIILFNPTSEKISGFSSAEAVGQRYDKVLQFIFEKTGKVNDEFIKQSLDLGHVVQMANHTLLIRKDGTKVPVADSAAPIKDLQGNVTGCVVVFRDVTKEREIDQMKSEFVSVASHQLRTPLTGIKWFSELMAKTKLNAKTKEYLHEIVVSTERMVRLVDDLLNVSRIDTGRKFDMVFKNMDVVPIVKSVILEQTPVAMQKEITITCSGKSPKSLVLSIDELKMRQVFQNLVNNAIKYSKEKTAIEVGCDESKNDEVVFYVKDHGVGIPLKQQVQVFNKFFRAENVMTMHTDGTGLGLYIAKAIVEAHHGKIWFESAENKGTTFFFTLPTKLIPETKVEEKKELLEEKPPAEEKKVTKKSPAEKNIAVDKAIAKKKVIKKFSKKK